MANKLLNKDVAFKTFVADFLFTLTAYHLKAHRRLLIHCSDYVFLYSLSVYLSVYLCGHTCHAMCVVIGILANLVPSSHHVGSGLRAEVMVIRLSGKQLCPLSCLLAHACCLY